MMKTGPDWIDDVRQRVSIVDVVSPYTALRPTGSSMRGPCPLHDGSGPNFSVSPSRNTYRCFVCNKSGDAFSFLQEIEGLSFIEAAKQLAAQVGVEVPTARPRRRTVAEELRASFQAHAREEAARKAGDAPSASGFVAAVDVWGALGLGGLVEGWSLGVRTDASGSRGLLPIPGAGDIPLGWVAYELGQDVAGNGVSPQRVGLEPGSEPAAEHQLVMSSRIRQALHSTPAVLVDDPIAVLALSAHGFGSAIAPVRWGVTGTGEDGIITEVQAARLRELGITQLRIAIPLGRDTDARRAAERAIYATEVVCVKAGIQPLLVGLEDDSEGPADWMWEWVARRSGNADAGELLKSALAGEDRSVDLFQTRVEKTARLLFTRPARLKLAEAMDKIRPTLEAAQESGDRALYHAYMAWAARAFRLPGRSRLAALLEAPGAQEAEIF